MVQWQRVPSIACSQRSWHVRHSGVTSLGVDLSYKWRRESVRERTRRHRRCNCSSRFLAAAVFFSAAFSQQQICADETATQIRRASALVFHAGEEPIFENSRLLILRLFFTTQHLKNSVLKKGYCCAFFVRKKHTGKQLAADLSVGNQLLMMHVEAPYLQHVVDR